MRAMLGERLTVFAAFFAVILVQLVWFKTPEVPIADALRYLQYIVAMNVHGVFGLAGPDIAVVTTPANANGPLYMALIAAVSYFDQPMQEAFVRLVTKANPACSLPFTSLYIVNALLAAAAIVLVFMLAKAISGSRSIAWLSAVVVFLSGELTEQAQLVAPENIMMPLFFALSWTTLLFYERRAAFRAVVIGALLLLLTLTRPSFIYLFYGYVLVFAGLLLINRSRRDFAHTIGLLAGFFILAAPWFLRNVIVLDSYALTSGNYAEIILTQRVAYNAMTWSEWAVAFLYWFPDFGDQLTMALFDPAQYERLGTGPNSYYERSMVDVYQPAVTASGGPQNVLGYLVGERVLAEPIKHIMVSMPLAWRAIFVGKLFGLAGAIMTALVIRHTLLQRDYRFVLLLVPMLFMVAFHAAVSVSIERYNLFLIAPYSIAIAWILQELVRTISNRKQAETV